MTFAGHEIIIDLLDTPMVHAFLTQRPMTLMSEDFNGNEKKTTTCNRNSQLRVTSTSKKRRGLLPKAGFADRYSVHGTDVDGAVQT